MSHAQAYRPDPRKIENLEAYLRTLNAQIEEKYAQISDAQRRRIARLRIGTPLWRLREQLADLVEYFDLALSEWESRRI